MSRSADARRPRLLSALVPAVVLCTAALVSSPTVTATSRTNEPCSAPDGMSLAGLYRVPVSVISPQCNQLRSGAQWNVSAAWFMNTGFAQVPPGFASDFGTPLADFRGKLHSVRYVIDPGTRWEKTQFLPNSAQLWIGEVPGADGLPAVNTVSLGAIDALSTGRHVVDVYWRFSAQHCDGLAGDPAHCFPAGETLVRHVTFEVVAP